jgi:hypothetical protein
MPCGLYTATAHCSTSSSLHLLTKPYPTRVTCPSTMLPRNAPPGTLSTKKNETVSHEGNMLINDATAHCSTSSFLHQPTKPNHTRATCSSTMPPRTAPPALLTTYQRDRLSHEGNMSINDATAHCSTSSSLHQATKPYHTRATCPSTMPPLTASPALYLL